MKKRRKATVKKELLRSIFILSSTIVLAFGSLVSCMLCFYETSRISLLLKEKNMAAKSFLEARFIKMLNMVEFLSNLEEVRNASLDAKAREGVLRLYQNLEVSDPDIGHIYSGYRDGSLLTNDYTPPEGYDPTVYPWYQEALRSFPEVSSGTLHTEMKTGEWLVALSKALVDNQGENSGVIAIDSPTEELANALREEAEGYASLHSFVVGASGEVLVHQKESLLGKRFQDTVSAPVSFAKPAGRFSYRLGNTSELAYYSHLDPLQWIVVTAVEKKELVTPILGKILAVIAAVGGVVALLSWFFGHFLERKFVHPLLLLKKRVGDIVSGNSRDEAIPHYLSDEVGEIFMDIEKLTKSALYEKNRELAAINEKLQLLSVTDQLTNLPNRHKMYGELEREFTRAKRYEGRFSIIMFDIDCLKEVNDTFGHQTGDAVLFEVSRLVSKTVRFTDTVFRWGGDEFLVLCPEASLEEAGVLASRIHSVVRTHRFPKDVRITISVGVSEFRKEKDVEELLTEVDRKLYEAKARGRDTVVT